MPLVESLIGPILSISPFDTEDEALRIANATEYGLASAVWTANLSRACTPRILLGALGVLGG